MNKSIRLIATFAAFGLLAAGCAITPQPLTRKEISDQVVSDLKDLYKDQEEFPSEPVTLERAASWALKYNLDHRVKLMEDAVALNQLDLLSYDMLPKITAMAGYTVRDSYNASSSMNVDTGAESLAPSTSQDKGHFTSDLTLSWNILDFGVSYYQAHQQADRALIMQERRRKAAQTIVQQVRQAYWTALGAQQLEDRFEPLLKDVKGALADASKAEQEKLKPPLEQLTYKKTLIETIRQLEGFRDELGQAKPRLAALMNLPPRKDLALVVPQNFDVPKFSDTVEDLENKALVLRPELREARLQERVTGYEAKKAIARMFPGIEFSTGFHSDNNSFLVNNSWYDGGFRMTWNLLGLISAPDQMRAAKSQEEVVKTSRLALSMAVLTQLHVALRDYVGKARQYELSNELGQIDAKIYEMTMKTATSGAVNKLAEIKAAASSLMAEYRRYQNYAQVQTAYSQILATVAEDPLVPPAVDPPPALAENAPPARPPMVIATAVDDI